MFFLRSKTCTPGSMFSSKSYEQYLTWQAHLRWSILRWNLVLCKLEDYSHLAMIPYCRNLLEKEIVEWHKWYLPQKSIEGKTVLDIGAGCLPKGHLILGATKDISEYQAAEPVFSSNGLS